MSWEDLTRTPINRSVDLVDMDAVRLQEVANYLEDATMEVKHSFTVHLRSTFRRVIQFVEQLDFVRP
jgi:hypothetical protein